VTWIYIIGGVFGALFLWKFLAQFKRIFIDINTREKALGEVARRRGGRLKRQYRTSRLFFPHRKRVAQLEFLYTREHSIGTNRSTEEPVAYGVALKWNISGLANFRIHIYKEGPLARLGKWLGGEDVQVGDPHFDDRFVVKTDDERRLRAFLDDDTRASLLRLQAMRGGIRMGSDGRHLMFEQHQAWEASRDLDRFIDEVSKICDAYLAATGFD
jgi:hypothetical protein